MGYNNPLFNKKSEGARYNFIKNLKNTGEDDLPELVAQKEEISNVLGSSGNDFVELKKAYLEQQVAYLQKKFERLFYFSPSLLGNCYFSAVLKSFFYITEYDINSAEIFAKGKIIEDAAVKRAIRHLYGLSTGLQTEQGMYTEAEEMFADYVFQRRVAREVIVFQAKNDYVLSGRIDALVFGKPVIFPVEPFLSNLASQNAGYDGDLFLLEIKSKDENTLRKLNDAYESHKIQAGLYLTALHEFFPQANIKGYVVYFPRDTAGPIKMFPVRPYQLPLDKVKVALVLAEKIARMPVLLPDMEAPVSGKTFRNILYLFQFYLEHFAFDAALVKSYLFDILEDRHFEAMKRMKINFNMQPFVLRTRLYQLSQQGMLYAYQHFVSKYQRAVSYLQEPSFACRFCPLDVCPYKK